ncbi:MAG: glycosyltransferase, partial [Desulfobacteraceae bacterium]
MPTSDTLNPKPTISACLIVKNEEKVLATCLQSIRNYVNEIIVVDTGSSDRTVEIAESFGARVYHHPWENHFSKHRNQSLAYARGDWLLVIDADEELPHGSADVLRDAVKKAGDADALAVLLECPFDRRQAKAALNSLRLLRNRRGLHYEGRVHNSLIGVKKALCTPARLLHHGYVADRETQLRRFKRTTELLNLDIAEDPANPRPHHFLAAAYLSENRLTEAVGEAEQALTLFEARNQLDHNYLWSLYIAASACFDLGRTDQAETLAQKAAQTNPDHLDAFYLLTLIAYARQDRMRFSTGREQYLAIKSRIRTDPGRFGEMVHNTFDSEWRLHLLDAFLNIGDSDDERFRRLLDLSQSLCPDLFLFFQQTAACYWQQKNYAQAKDQYLQALALRPGDTGTLWVLAHAYEKLKDDQSRIPLLEKLLQIDPQFPHARFQLALACMHREHFQKSYDLFTEAAQAEPGNRLIPINQALCLRGLQRYTESIQASESIATREPPEQIALTGNLAYCFYALRQWEPAALYFLKWRDLQPESPEPLIHLARISIERREIERCVVHCDRLLTLLGLNQN